MKLNFAIAMATIAILSTPILADSDPCAIFPWNENTDKDKHCLNKTWRCTITSDNKLKCSRLDPNEKSEPFPSTIKRKSNISKY